MSLAEGLVQLAEASYLQSLVDVEVSIACDESTPLSPSRTAHILAITKEALSNVAKHAQASRATVKLEIYPAQACVTIQDNGHGFDLEETLRRSRRAGWGLLGIQERALLLGGRYEINSKPGCGTLIRVTVPLMVEARDVQYQTPAG